MWRRPWKYWKDLITSPPKVNVVSEQETSDISKSSETENNPISVIQEEEISLFSESSEWEHLSEFEDIISDSSDND